MFTINTSYFVLLIFLAKVYNIKMDEKFCNKDKPYDIITIQIPKKIYLEALNPTPILKSSATIVLPVYVSQDENQVDEVEDLDINEEEHISENPAVTNVTETAPANDVTQNPVSPSNTQAPIADSNVTNAEQNVTGQVFRFPCTCENNECTCCTGSILERIKMKACGKIAFVPEDFVFDVKLTVNGRTVIRRRVSASDPPPICFNPRRAPFVNVCLEISNIRIRNRNAFACLDIEADIASFSVYSASFRCFGLGASGLQTGLKPKPASSGPKPVSLYGTNSDDRGSFLENALGLFGGSTGGLFGGDSDGDGPLDAIGDAVGDLFGRDN